MVVAYNVTGHPAINSLEGMNVLFEMGIPYGTGIVQDGADVCDVDSLFEGGWALL